MDTLYANYSNYPQSFFLEAQRLNILEFYIKPLPSNGVSLTIEIKNKYEGVTQELEKCEFISSSYGKKKENNKAVFDAAFAKYASIIHPIIWQIKTNNTKSKLLKKMMDYVKSDKLDFLEHGRINILPTCISHIDDPSLFSLFPKLIAFDSEGHTEESMPKYVQIAIDKDIYIFTVDKFKTQLRQWFLDNKDIKIFMCDADIESQQFGWFDNNIYILDIQKIILTIPEYNGYFPDENRKYSLTSIIEAIYNLPLIKNPEILYRDWDIETDQEQRDYAIIDIAWIYIIGKKILM